MPVIKLDDRKIRSLKVDRQTDFYDARFRAFGLRVGHTGRKTFFVRYFYRGKRRRDTLGVMPVVGLAKARRDAAETIRKANDGIDPRRHSKGEITFAEVAKMFMEWAKREKREKTWKEYERILNKNLLKPLGHIPVVEITRADIRGILDRIYARGAPVMTKRTRTLASGVLNFAIQNDWLELNVVAGIKLGIQEDPRQRFLNENEIRTLWNLWESSGATNARILQFLLLTGQRSNEVKTLEWTEISERKNVWTIPPQKTKNRRIHLVPLAPQALRVLDRAKTRSVGSKYVFPSFRRPDTHVVSLNKVMANYRELASFHFCIHDLRRTCSTFLFELGIHDRVVSGVLNHTPRDITNRVYNVPNPHYLVDEKREALCAWGNRVDEIVCTTDNVVALKTASAS